MSDSSLIVRADAGVEIGTGHVMRCLALAQAWRDAGGRVAFAMAQTTPAIRGRVADEADEIIEIASTPGSAEDALQTIAAATAQRADWVVVDGYHFAADFQRALKNSGFKVLVVDDHGHARHYFANLVLNQNLFASESLYSNRDSNTLLLLGPRYCLLRREFAEWIEWKREIPPVGRRLLVTMGGSDPANVTTRVMDALRMVDVNELETIVVIGGSNPHPEFERLPNYKGRKISVRKAVSNVAELMAWADVAISSAGTTCWELCFMALPSLLVDVAVNQTASARELGRRGCAIHLGNVEEFLPELAAIQLEKLLKSEQARYDLSVRCRELVDSLGAERVVHAMRAGLKLRPVREEDCRVLWEWVNDPQVRAAAFSSGPVPWEQHKAWFASRMEDPNCRILVAENGEGRPMGQLRVDWHSDQDGYIDVSVAPESRGTGNGGVLIDIGASIFFAERGERLHALVKVENMASRRAFERAGFMSLGEESVHGHLSVHYVRTKMQNKN